MAFQVYSARNSKPYADVLQRIAALGYTQVEGFGGVYDDPARFRAMMNRHGLTMPSGHFAVSQLETGFDASAAIARTLGVTTIVCPFLPSADRPSGAAGWAAFAARLEALAQRSAAAGFNLAWHNHDFEFAKLDDGRTILSVLLGEAPSLG